MKNPFRSWGCLSLLLVICVFDTLAQINPAYQDMMKNQEMGSSRRRRNVGVQDSMTLANSAFMGIRDSTIERLKTVGVDYLSIYKKDLRDLNEKDKTVLSDCVVIGTVMSIERTPHDRHFATVAHVKVEEFLRNDYNLPLGQIPVMIVSGPIGSGYQRMGNEDTLALGEHVVLFLSAKMLLKSMIIDTAYFNRLINDPMVRFSIIGFDGKYHIQGQMAYCQWGGEDLLKMKEGIKAVAALLRHSPSADKMDAPVNPVYKEVQKNRKAITKGRRQVKPNVTIIEPFVDLGYDDSTLARLKKVGAHIENLHLIHPSTVTAKIQAALSDCIIIGTVTKKEYPLQASDAALPFGTIAHLNVEEFLRNDYHVPASDLQVMIHSGPSLTEVGEDTLIVGERYLLFLSARDLLTDSEFLKNEFYRKLIHDPTVKFQICQSPRGEYRIRDGSLFNEAWSRNLQKTKDEIRTVVNVISQQKR